AAATTAAAAATSTAAACTDVDGCPGATNDISLVEMWRGQRRRDSLSQHRRRRSGIWPTTHWLRKLRNQKAAAQDVEPSTHHDQDLGPGRRSSVLLMVLLSTSDEVKAKTILVSEQQAIKPEVKLDEEDVEDAIDALWL
ncbi:hypothetical protein KR009_011852, partial [Drosophila setifemur]